MAKKNITHKEHGDSRKIVRRIMAHHFGQDRSKMKARDKPSRITPLTGGITNLVFAVETGRGNYIVRLGAEAGKISAFLKEQWAIAKAHDSNVPTPEVLEVGCEAAPVPYMIARQSPGTEATYHPERLNIIRDMGRYAAVINSIPTTGFGSSFDWSHNQLSHNASWNEYLHHELKMDERLETLESSGMLDAARIKRVRTALEEAAGPDRTPFLNHGDLRLKNVLVDKKGAITCILDWEHCTSNLAPEWELSLALHDLSIDEKQAFLEGYGLNGEQISRTSPALKALTLINYAPVIAAATKCKDKAGLECHRLRLSGALDLYSV